MGRESGQKGKALMRALAMDLGRAMGVEVSLQRSPRRGDLTAPPGCPWFVEAKNDERWTYRSWVLCEAWPAFTLGRGPIISRWLAQCLTDWACDDSPTFPALAFTRRYEPVWVMTPERFHRFLMAAWPWETVDVEMPDGRVERFIVGRWNPEQVFQPLGAMRREVRSRAFDAAARDERERIKESLRGIVIP